MNVSRSVLILLYPNYLLYSAIIVWNEQTCNILYTSYTLKNMKTCLSSNLSPWQHIGMMLKGTYEDYLDERLNVATLVVPEQRERERAE